MERPIRQEAHLRVTAFACVPAQSVGQRDYLLEGQQRRRTHDARTRAAACTLTPKECSSPAWQIGQTR